MPDKGGYGPGQTANPAAREYTKPGRQTRGDAVGPGVNQDPLNDPFNYLKLGEDSGYLGHFKEEKFLEEGHNTSAAGLAGKKAKLESLAGGATKQAAKQAGRTARQTAYNTEHPVKASMAQGRASVKAARVGVKLAKATGGDVAAAKAGVKSAKTTRTLNNVAARKDPNAAGMERKAAKVSRLTKKLSRVKGTYSA